VSLPSLQVHCQSLTQLSFQLVYRLLAASLCVFWNPCLWYRNLRFPSRHLGLIPLPLKAALKRPAPFKPCCSVAYCRLYPSSSPPSFTVLAGSVQSPDLQLLASADANRDAIKDIFERRYGAYQCVLYMFPPSTSLVTFGSQEICFWP
jgi:hypothetical protein